MTELETTKAAELRARLIRLLQPEDLEGVTDEVIIAADACAGGDLTVDEFVSIAATELTRERP